MMTLKISLLVFWYVIRRYGHIDLYVHIRRIRIPVYGGPQQPVQRQEHIRNNTKTQAKSCGRCVCGKKHAQKKNNFDLYFKI